jgi:hydroxymethylglutaryl-CoA lyase
MWTRTGWPGSWTGWWPTAPTGSRGGLGGCPYAPGASGNVATEEVVHLLHDLGVDTGIDLQALLDVARLAERIVGRELPSGVLRAGPRLPGMH